MSTHCYSIKSLNGLDLNGFERFVFWPQWSVFLLFCGGMVA